MTTLSIFIVFIPVLILSGCSGESGPVSIPVPFSGSLTDVGTLGFAEGSPVSGRGAALQVEGTKNQSNASPTWLVFDPTTGVERGSVTFFPETLEIQKIESLASGGTRRVSTMKAAANIDGVQAITSSFECFDYPTDYPTTFSADECSGNREGIPVVRKMTCSGVDDFTGLLFDGKFIMGMIQDPNQADTVNEFQFCTQQESYVFVRGLPFSPIEGRSEANVVFTMIVDGGGEPIPDDPDMPIMDINKVVANVLLPGSDDIQGQMTMEVTAFEADPPDSINAGRATSFQEFRLNDDRNSRIVIRNCQTLLNRVPELTDVMKEAAQIRYSDYSGLPELLEKGEVFFNTIGDGKCDPINCAEDSPDVDGKFRDLCDQFGGRLTTNYLCFILQPTDTLVIPIVFFTSVWAIVQE